MKKIRSFLLLLLVISIVSAGLLLIPPSWPQANPPPQTGELEKKCSVIRDKFDIPHIIAQSNREAFYCWGKVDALDRAWQMDYLRRTASGRMAEYYGMKYVKQDFFFRLLQLRKYAKKWLEQTPKQQRAYLEFYAWGVNSGFKELQNRGKMPYQFKKFGMRLVPWKATDTLALLLLQSFFQTRKSFTSDLKAERRKLALGKKRYLQLFGSDQKLHAFDFPIIKKGEHKLTPLKHQPSSQPKSKSQPAKQGQLPSSGKHRKLARLQELKQFQDFIESFAPIASGSNNWVVSSRMTENGAAMLANDPHLKLTTPSFWHEVHIKTPTMNIMGLAVPGTPTIAFGNNKNMAWGITNGYMNVADIIEVTVKNNKIKLGNQVIAVQTIRPIVQIKKGSFHLPVFWKTFQVTKLGPILPIKHKAGKKLLLRWSAFHMKGSTLGSLLDYYKAKNVQEFEKALRKWELPAWNIVFADSKGQIGYRQVGLFPKRQKGNHGFIDPNDPKQRWNGFLSPEESPFVLNPKKGYIATANNRTFSSSYPYFIGHAFSKGHRGRRIEAMLQKHSKHNFKSMQRIQTDTLVPAATILLRHMLKAIHKYRAKLPPQQEYVLQILAKWDKQAQKHKVAPTVFRLWYQLLKSSMFQKDKVRPGLYAMLKVFQSKIPSGSDLPLEQLAHLSFQKCFQKLSKDLGHDPKKWRWERYHRLNFVSLLKEKHYPIPPSHGANGDKSTVLVSDYKGKGPYRVRVSPSYRLMIELGPRIRSYGVLPSRNIDKSSKKLSKQQKLWFNQKYRPRPFYPEEIMRHTKSRMQIIW